MDELLKLVSNYSYVLLLLGLIVCLLVYVLKIPIKKLTAKITDEAKRKKTNIIIYILPFAVGILVFWIYALITKAEFVIWIGIQIGGIAIVIYNLLERFKKGKVETFTNTQFVEKVTATITDTSTTKETKTDEVTDAVKELYKSL
jgi:hypothetical protein